MPLSGEELLAILEPFSRRLRNEAEFLERAAKNSRKRNDELRAIIRDSLKLGQEKVEEDAASGHRATISKRKADVDAEHVTKRQQGDAEADLEAMDVPFVPPGEDTPVPDKDVSQ